MTPASEHAMAIDTYKVEFRFELAHGDRRVLEEKAAVVLDALEEHTADAVTGAAAAATFEPPTLEVDFTVEATSLAEFHRILAEVVQVLEEHGGIGGLAGTSFTESARPERDLVPA